jgi:hypothetical protein
MRKPTWLPDSPAAAHKNIHVGDRIMAVAQGKEPPVQSSEEGDDTPANMSIRVELVLASR